VTEEDSVVLQSEEDLCVWFKCKQRCLIYN